MIEEISESPFDRQERIAWWDQACLFATRVMVVGAGALGNEVLKNLALVGVGNIFVIDFDTIDDSNLSRAVLFRQADVVGKKVEIAAERTRQLSPNPNINVRAMHGDVVWELGTGVYRHLDLVIGCLDNIEARLAVNAACWRAGVPWIDGGIYELSGSVSVFDASAEKACYECTMDPERYRRAHERYSCTNQTVKANIRKGREPTTQTTSAIIAAIQTQEAIKILHGLESFAGRKLVYHGYRQNFVADEPNALTMVELPRNPDCLCHGLDRCQNVVEWHDARAAQVTARQALERARDELELVSPRLELGRQFVVAAECGVCGTRTELKRPLFRVQDSEVACPTCQVTCPRCGQVSQGLPDCPNCGQTDISERALEMFHQLGLGDEAYLDWSLAALGVPAGHVLAFRGERGHPRQVELTGDVTNLFENT